MEGSTDTGDLGWFRKLLICSLIIINFTNLPNGTITDWTLFVLITSYEVAYLVFWIIYGAIKLRNLYKLHTGEMNQISSDYSTNSISEFIFRLQANIEYFTIYIGNIFSKSIIRAIISGIFCALMILEVCCCFSTKIRINTTTAISETMPLRSTTTHSNPSTAIDTTIPHTRSVSV
ncbi:unnamed protein product [Rotaria sordida]|uniref:Uncharacterized protein n=1 Tax=Rotaria sordida TaxID=392033 RepID=A0A814HV51_9BILA|nr:unnamed protein product [Rotaria sordida]